MSMQWHKHAAAITLLRSLLDSGHPSDFLERIIITAPGRLSLTHPLTRSLTHSLTHPRTHSLTHPRTHPLTHSEVGSLPQDLRKRLDKGPGRPVLVVLPYPVGVTNASNWSSISGAYHPPARRRIAVLYLGAEGAGQPLLSGNDFRFQFLLKFLFNEFWGKNANVTNKFQHQLSMRHGFSYICAPKYTDDRLCGVQPALVGKSAASLVTASDFCIFSWGQNPSMHTQLYLAVLSGCIPVLFDFESDRVTTTETPKTGAYRKKTAWAWRNTPHLHLNYSHFAIVLDARHINPSSSLLTDLVAMPTAQPVRFKALREGVDRAAKWMRLGATDCEGTEGKMCDAFSVLKAFITQRGEKFKVKKAKHTL